MRAFITGRHEEAETREGSETGGSEPVEEGLGELVNASTSVNPYFNPLLLFEQLVQDYQHVADLYGESLIRILTGRPAAEVKRNIHIPEYQEQLREHAKRLAHELRRQKLISKDQFTSKALREAARALLRQAGEKHAFAWPSLPGKTRHEQGEKIDVKPWHGEAYRQISVRDTIRRAILRQHQHIQPEDVRIAIRAKREQKHVIILLDVSGSMRGWKIRAARKALASLAIEARELGDTLSLIAFDTTIRLSMPRVHDEQSLARLLSLTPQGKTDLRQALREAQKYVQPDEPTEVILITDLQETVTSPQAVLREAERLARMHAKLRVILIQPTPEVEAFGRKLASLTQGSLYTTTSEQLEETLREAYHAED